MTIKEIAQLAGVSISTVSKIVNGKDENINPKTRERVLQIVKEYHYTPYGIVVNRTDTRRFQLGVLLKDVSSSSEMLSGILAASRKYGYSILLLDSQNCSEIEAKCMTALHKDQIDGFLWEPISPDSLHLSTELSRQGIPYFLLNGFPPLPFYAIDFYQLGYQMTEQMLACYHTNIACLTSQNMDRRSALVLEGFRKCLFDHQLPYASRMSINIFNSDYPAEILRYGYTGIISPFFQDALNLYEELRRLHYLLPADCSLISLTDQPAPDKDSPGSSISCLSIPWKEFGAYVCTHLIKTCEKTISEPPARLFSCNSAPISPKSLTTPPSLRGKRFVVVGAINMDISFNVGELPQYGKTIKILSSSTSIGGKAANQSIGAARLGHEVVLIGELGNDTDATFIFDTLGNNGVITETIHRDKQNQTGKAYIFIREDSESAISVLPGANDSLSPKLVKSQRNFFKDAGYCLISTEIPIASAEAAVFLAREYHVVTIVKPATLSTISDELLKATDILVPNRAEAATLCPQYDTVEDQALYFLQKGVKTVIITLGHEGCYLRTASDSRYFPAAAFTAVDTTGGADAFIAALASYLSNGYSLEKAIRIATYAAGFCVSRQGVVPSLVDKNTLEGFIAKKEPGLIGGLFR